MERIYKKISLESLKTRTLNKMPYIPINEECSGLVYPSTQEESWGNILADIDGIAQTKDLLVRYNWMLELIRNGIKLQRKRDLKDCGDESSYNTYVQLTGDFDIEQFNYGVYDFYDFTKTANEYIPNIGNVSEDVIVLVYYDENEQRVDVNFLKDVYNILNNRYMSGGTRYIIPKLSISLALVQDVSDLGVMTNYEEEGVFPEQIASAYTYEEVGGVSWDTKYSNEPNPLEAGDTEASNGQTTDSKLYTLRTKEYYTDDLGNLLPGVFKKITRENQNSILWKYTYSNGTITRDTHSYSATGFKCVDGYSNAECANKQVYRTATIESTVEETLKSSPANGDYYFYVKYDNSYDSPMDIPYNVIDNGKNVFNKYSYEENGVTYNIGDFITSITYPEHDGEQYIRFEYVLGGEYDESGYVKGGVMYEEEYLYTEKEEMDVTLDDCENVTIFYDKIDYEFSQETIYNSDLMLSRIVNLTSVSAYTKGDVWRDGMAINAPVFKEDYLMGFDEGISIDINVEVDRGNAAAFERHLKLSECNSFSDLENYGNNYYNL